MHRLQEVVRLHRMGRSSRVIARQLQMGRNTIKGYLEALARGGPLGSQGPHRAGSPRCLVHLPGHRPKRSAYQGPWTSRPVSSRPECKATTGHVVGRGSERIDVFFADGRAGSARLVGSVAEHGEDWGLLELLDADPGSLPGLPTGSVAPGELVVLLGHPGGMGIDARGRVVMRAGYEPEPLDAIAVVARVLAAPGLQLELVAGALPFAGAGGMSGGPIFNRRGEIIGLLSGLDHANDEHGNPLYTLSATSPPADAAISRILVDRGPPSAEELDSPVRAADPGAP